VDGLHSILRFKKGMESIHLILNLQLHTQVTRTHFIHTFVYIKKGAESEHRSEGAETLQSRVRCFTATLTSCDKNVCIWGNPVQNWRDNNELQYKM